MARPSATQFFFWGNRVDIAGISAGEILLFNGNFLYFMDGAGELFALDVDFCHFVLGVAVDENACPELSCAFFCAVVGEDNSAAFARLNCVLWETLTCASA